MPRPVHRTYRITIDVETASHPEPSDITDHDSPVACAHKAVLQRLQDHPEILEKLLRSLVISKVNEASMLLAAEYGSRISEHEVLQPILAELQPEAQAPLVEELEDGFQTYYFDGFAASVKGYQMTMRNLEHRSHDPPDTTPKKFGVASTGVHWLDR
jgi:hypothetical protein